MGERPEWATAAIARARSSWPQVQLDEDAFIAHVVACAAAAGCAPDALQLDDLWLALACAQGSMDAVTQFDRSLGAMIATTLRRVFKSRSDLEDAHQRLRERLFVGPPPRILDYGGTGPLGAWVRVAALRIALNDDRGQRTRARLERAAAPGGWSALDPELELMRRRYAKELDRALKVALAQLESEERLLLRLHYLEGVALAQLSKMHKVDPSTMSRRLSRARKHAMTMARDELERQLSLSPATAESLIRMLESRMDISLGALRSGN